MNAVIYARYSSDRQTEDSIAAQVRACRDYAAIKGLNVVEVYADEAISGKGSKTVQKRVAQTGGKQIPAFGTICLYRLDKAEIRLLHEIIISHAGRAADGSIAVVILKSKLCAQAPDIFPQGVEPFGLACLNHGGHFFIGHCVVLPLMIK